MLLVFACGSGPVGSSPNPASSATTAASPSAIPSASPTPPGDACHQGGITYCALNPAVTQATITQTICVSGWTRTIRPPASYTSALKLRQMQTEGLSGSPSSYEEDHRIPLELGGAPRDPQNLSPELGRSPNAKDLDENVLREQVCSGILTLVEAQAALRDKWLGPYPTYKE